MNTMLKYKLLFLLSLTIACFSGNAQSLEVKAGQNDDDKVKITPMGRIYFDGAFYFDDDTDLSNRVTIPDARIGLKAVYKKWDVKLDLGFGSNKATVKDIHLRYNFSKNSSLKLGHYGEMFGYANWESSSTTKFNGKSGSTSAFESGRVVGLAYSRYENKYWMALGVYSDKGAFSNTTEGDNGYSTAGRLLYTPFKQSGKILHVGLSGTIRKADANGFDEDGKENPRKISYTGSFGPTAIEKRKPLSATITDADYQAKYVAEALGSYGPVFVLAEYYHANVKRKSALPTYKASGGYVMVGFLALGDCYEYGSESGRMKLPKPSSLEIVAQYDYLDLDDDHSGIYGGRENSIAVAANYYLNKLITLKANYYYLKLGHRSVIAPGEKIHSIQARVMVLF